MSKFGASIIQLCLFVVVFLFVKIAFYRKLKSIRGKKRIKKLVNSHLGYLIKGLAVLIAVITGAEYLSKKNEYVPNWVSIVVLVLDVLLSIFAVLDLTYLYKRVDKLAKLKSSGIKVEDL